MHYSYHSEMITFNILEYIALFVYMCMCVWYMIYIYMCFLKPKRHHATHAG